MKSARLRYGQLSDQGDDSGIAGADRETLERLGRVFKVNDDLASENAITYDIHKLAAELPDESTPLNWLNRVTWGYGLRPWRLAGWMLMAFLGFTAIYATATSARLLDTLRFSWRTSWTWKFGYEHAQSAFFRALTLVQACGMKILALLFLRALSNTSPLLKEIVDKLFTVA